MRVSSKVVDQAGKRHANADLMPQTYDEGGIQSIHDIFLDEALIFMDLMMSIL